MRIAFVVGPFPSVSETFILSQMTALLDRGHEVNIYANAAAAPVAQIHGDVLRYRLLERTHHLHRVPANRILRAADGAARLLAAPQEWRAKLLRACNPFVYGREALDLRLLRAALPLVPPVACDVIHCHFGHLGQRAALLRELGFYKGKLITTFHGYDTFPGRQPWRVHGFYRRLFARADRILAVSRAIQSRVIELGCNPSLVRVQHMGIDCDRFRYRARQRVGDEPFRLLSVGRLVRVKGHEHGIRAVARLVHEGVRCVYDIVGDGPLRAELETLVARLGITEQVRFAGAKTHEEIAACLADAHVFVLPSLDEGLGVSLLEAMSSGLPVVASSVGGIPEAVEEGGSGHLVPPGDDEALAAALRRLLSAPERWAAMGQAGRARVERDHRMERVIDSLERNFEEVLS